MMVVSVASVDVTTLFKSCVKTIRTRNKAIGVSFPPSKILPSAGSTQFFIKAKDVQANIVSHERLLAEHKKKYLNDNATSLSDIERAYMDKVISRNLKFVEDNIRNLESEIKDNNHSDSLSKNAKECQLSVINILRANYLRTCAQFRDMKDHRQKKQKEKEQLFRLTRPAGLKKSTSSSVTEKPKLTSRQRRSSGKSTSESIDDKCSKRDSSADPPSKIGKRNDSIADGNTSGNLISSPGTAAAGGIAPQPYKNTFLEDELEGTLKDLDEEERQVLEEENARLYSELMSNQEEVKQITKQVVELSRMQDILTENVEIQSQQIEEIHDTILHATDNVQRGNEQVREAMRRDAGFRVWIMFFLIVMSCTILFLDWYNL